MIEPSTILPAAGASAPPTASTGGKPAEPAASAALPAPPARTPARRWSPDTWAAILTSVSTFAALVVAMLLGLHAMRTAEESLRSSAEFTRQSNLLAIYNLNQESMKFFEANPALVPYFDKTYRAGKTDQEVLESVPKLPQNQKILLELACEKIADFMQVVFLQRDVLPAQDWDNWWSSICDQYDEGPLLRDYLQRRAKWYAYGTALLPENRGKYYRLPAKK
jgi:hypothetical protein